MLRVPHSALSYSETDGIYLFEGTPFTGVAYCTYPSGQPKSEVEFRDGLRWGLSREWFMTGTMLSEGRFFRDVLDGHQQEWYENGRPSTEGQYAYGVAVWEKKWDEQGNLIDDYRVKETDSDFQAIQRYRAIYGSADSADASEDIPPR